MISIVILAGGVSSRFGEVKALVKILDKPMISYVISNALIISNNIIIVTTIPNIFNNVINANKKHNRVIILKDKYFGNSPLNGLLSAISIVSSEYLLVLPCDTPLLNINILKLLLNTKTKGDAVIPVWENGYIEPLHAIYKVEALKRSIYLYIQNPNISFRNFIKHLKNIQFIPIEYCKQLDPQLLTFYNINDYSDLNRVQEILLKTNMIKAAKLLE